MEGRFERDRDLCISWYNKASDLLGAAGAVWLAQDEEYSRTAVARLGLVSNYSMKAAVGPVYRMLCGMALELLYKAIVVAKGGVVETSHDLAALAANAGVEVSENERGLLSILSESVIWAGRYPVPKDPKYMDKFIDLSSKYLFDTTPVGKSNFRGTNHALAWEHFKALWDKGDSVYWKYHSDY